ncbi:MAG: ribose-phosphate diphosphokinase [Chlamydiia bacterium]|nr:ribose-phosphate diphosphokinase [Chlamydiia bacterium]
MSSEKQHYALFAGTSHVELAQEVAECLGLTLGEIDLGRFPDGEVSCSLKENVRGRDMFVLQSLGHDPDRFLIELLAIVDALKRASARLIVAVVPYLCYARQDRVDAPCRPILAKVVADVLQVAGVSAVLTFDLHTGQLEGFFDIPIDNLPAVPVLAEAYRLRHPQEFVVVAPDLGSVKLARRYASYLGVDLVIIDKKRLGPERVEVVALIGDVKGKDVLLADDMCSTGGTLVSAAKACQEKGAKRIDACVTHGLFVGDALKKIAQSPLETVLVSNTVPLRCEQEKLTVVSVAPALAEAIQCILSGRRIATV